MTFSKEDMAAWENSEVMRELEKIAEDVFSPSAEVYQPIKEDQSWEEEDWSDEQKITDAASELLNELDDNTIYDELREANNIRLLYKLEKIGEELVDKSNIKAAYRVERSIQEIKALLREEK